MLAYFICGVKMPVKSKKQERLMLAVAHNKEFAKKVGISQKLVKNSLKRNGRRNNV
jgi:hypothetical protein